MTQYRGQVVRTTIVDIVADPFYTLRARIETGDLAQRNCFVRYQGDPDSVGEHIVTRLEWPYERKSHLDLNGEPTSHFVSSQVPDEFEYANAEEIVLCAVFHMQVPRIGDLIRIYDPGSIFSAYRRARSGTACSRPRPLS